MLTAGIQAIVTGWLPGAVIFRAPLIDRDRRAALDAAERLFWQVLISVVLSLAAVLALASLGRYSLQRVVAVDLGVAALIAVLSRFRLRLGAAAPRPGWSVLVPLTLVVLGVWRFFPPSEYIIGGKDPGVYISEGVQIGSGALSAKGSDRRRGVNFARSLLSSEQRRDYYSGLVHGLSSRIQKDIAVASSCASLLLRSRWGMASWPDRRAWRGSGQSSALAAFFCWRLAVGRGRGAAGRWRPRSRWVARHPNAEAVMQPPVRGAR